MKRLLAFVVLIFSVCAYGGKYDLPPEAFNAAAGGIKAIYSLDFKEAQEQIDEGRRLLPGHPYAFFGDMMIAWARYEFEYEKSSEDNRKYFESLIDASIKGINLWLKDHPKDPHAFMSLGGAYGLRSRFAMANKSWISAYFSGKKGIGFMEKAVKEDPAFYDAYLGLGMYEYYAGTLPSVIKILSTVVAAGGSPKKGIEQLTLCGEKGVFAADTCKLILVDIYNDRNGPFYNPALALEYIRGVRARYPGNPLMGFVEIIVDYENKNFDKVIDGARAFYSKIGVEPFYGDIYRARAYTALGTAFMAKGDFEMAVTVFEAAYQETLQGAEPTRWAVWNLVRLGQAYDALGERDSAIAAYRLARGKKDAWGFDDEIKKFLKTPFTPETEVGPMPPL